MNERLELTLKDRLILANQHEILAAICKDYHEVNHHKTASIVFKKGYEDLYEKYVDISDVFTEEESDEVITILNLYRDLINSFIKAKEKTGTEMKGEEVYFPGFDHNDPKEARMCDFAKFYCKNEADYHVLNKYVKDRRTWNSHGSKTIDDYKRMNEKARSMSYLSDGYFSIEQIREILKA